MPQLSGASLELRRILFATDFSLYSADAREYAVLLSLKFGAEVIVFHAIEKISYLGEEDRELAQWYADLERDLHSKLQAEIAYFKQRKIQARGELSAGVAWRSVIEYAEANQVDLLVIGSHGTHTPEGALILGTTSHKIALVANIPILIIKSGQKDRAGQTQGA